MRKWEKPQGRRNEALDCRVYALTALHILNPDLELLASRMSSSTNKTEVVDELEHNKQSLGISSVSAFSFRRRTGGFVTNW